MTETNLPENWAACTFGDITSVVSGGTPPSKDPSNFAQTGGIPWITPADLSGYKQIYISRGARNLTEKGLASSSATRIEAGSVLFSSRAPIGYVAIAANELTTNQGFKSFVLPRGVESRYIYYYLRYIKPLAEERATGTTFKELSGAATTQLPLLIAPSNEQKRIADKLDLLLEQVDDCRAKLDRVSVYLKQFRKTILLSAFTGELSEEWRTNNPHLVSGATIAGKLRAAHSDAGGHRAGNAASPTDGVHDFEIDMFPPGWEIVELRDVVQPERPITYGILMPGPELQEGISYIRVADYPNDRLNLATIRRTSTAIDTEFARSRLLPGDLLLSIRGTVGRLVVTPTELAGANITQDTARLSIQSAVNRNYILWFLRSDLSQSRMKRATKGVAVRGINIGDVRALQVPLPSREEQDEIVLLIERAFAFADQLEAKMQQGYANIEGLTPVILSKAFRGELVPQDPNDEPASVLLERIREDRKTASAPVRKQPRPRAINAAQPGFEVLMLRKRDLQSAYLTEILKARGKLAANELWTTSQLDIDDFYDQLKAEAARGTLRVVRQEGEGGTATLEPTS